MKAALFREIGQPLSIEEVQIDKPNGHEVLVRTAACGVCRSDLHYIEGHYPHPTPTILGHEAAGVVEAVGDQVHYVRAGDRVITCLSVFCGHCDFCVTGRPYSCKNTETAREETEPSRITQSGKDINQ